MHHPHLFFRLTHHACTFLLVATLGACGLFEKPEPPKPAPVRVEKQAYKPKDYVLNLTLARMALIDGDMNAARVHAEILNEYGAKGNVKKKKLARENVAILEYKTRESDQMKQLVAPVAVSADSAFPELQQALNTLEGKHATVYNVKISTVSVSPSKTIALKNVQPEQLDLSLQERMNALLATSRKLPPLEEAQMQVQLGRFFMHRQLRDAAYISVENAKQLLAAAESQKSEAKNEEELARLIDEHQVLESHLRKSMPYPAL